MQLPVSNPEVEFVVSTYPSRFWGYQSKARGRGRVTTYVSTIWKTLEASNDADFDTFVLALAKTTLEERICIERAFQKVRMKQRCRPVCKIGRVSFAMNVLDKKSVVELRSGDFETLRAIYRDRAG